MRANKTLICSMVLAVGIFFTVAASPALAMNEDLVGAVVKTDQGAAFSTDAGEYLFLGKNLTGMIGKTVSVTGNVEDGVLSNTIRVKSAKVLSNKDYIDPSTARSAPASNRSAA
jgi:hypothetical protein